jgi:hypothetical protein
MSKIFFVFQVLLFLTLSCTHNSKIKLSHPIITMDSALVLNDSSFFINEDIDSYPIKVLTPRSVSKTMSLIIDRANDSLQDVFKLDKVYRMSYDFQLYLYICKMKGTYSGVIRYYFLLNNDVNDKVTQIPPSINGKWMSKNEGGFKEQYKLLKAPLISFEDIDNDFNKEIIVKERLHNGSIYNAVIQNYFKVDLVNLSLTRIFCLEIQAFHPFDNQISVYRQFKNNTIYTKLISNKNDGLRDTSEIGTIKVNFIDGHINMGEENLSNSIYGRLLITNSNIEGNRFLRNGYHFTY